MACARTVEMDKEGDAVFLSSSTTELYTIAWILITRLGVRRPQTTTRTRDGVTVFPNVRTKDLFTCHDFLLVLVFACGDNVLGCDHLNEFN